MFELQDEGTIWLVRPLTEDVRDWDFHFPACISARRRRWYSRLY